MRIASSDTAAILSFAAVLCGAVAIVALAARRNKTSADYFVAGGKIGAWSNALALAGDFVAAGGFLSITGLIALYGADGMVFAVGVIAGWPLMLFLFAEPLRRLGKFTLADVLVSRLRDERVRPVVAANQILIILAVMTAQLVGASAIIRLLFGISTELSLVIIGAVVGIYVLFGGMLATTWLQIVKAVLMIAIATGIAVAALTHFAFSPLVLVHRAVALRGPQIVMPNQIFGNSFDTVSLLLGLALGGASMPHMLIRLNTAIDPRGARQAVFLGTGIIVIFHLILLILGFSAMVLVGASAIRALDPGGNMALPLLADLVGGNALLGIVSAITIATILAVCSGLGIAAAATLSHDLWQGTRLASQSPRGELLIGRISGTALMMLSLVLAWVFRDQNLGFLSALGGALAASANFPILLLAIFYPRFTAAGAIAGMVAAMLTNVVLIYLSPLVQVSVLGHANAVFPLHNPGIVSIPVAILAALIVSASSGATRLDPASSRR